MKFFKNEPGTGQGLLKVFKEDLVDGPLGKGVLIIPECVDWVAPDAFEDLDNLETIILSNLFLKTEEFAKKQACFVAKWDIFDNTPLTSDVSGSYEKELDAIKESEVRLAKELKIDWSRCPNVKNIIYGVHRIGYHINSDEEESYLRWVSNGTKQCLQVPDHISFKSVYKEDFIKAISQEICDEAKSKVFDRLRMTLPSHRDRGQTLFLSPEIFRKFDQFADIDMLKQYHEGLDKFFIKVDKPKKFSKLDSSIKQYKKTINKMAFLFCLMHIYQGVKRLTKSDALSDAIKLDARKKCYVIIKLRDKIQEDISTKKLFSSLEARFLLHEGKGRIKHLLDEFMPKLKTKLELLANSEVHEETSPVSAHAVMKV